MGWAAEATSRMQLCRYRVRQWTAFVWTDRGDTDRVQNIERASRIIERRLIDRYPQAGPRVICVTVDGQQQMMFEMDVLGEHEADARRRGVYRFDRALRVKVPMGWTKGQSVRLTPPWGTVEVELIERV